MDEELAIARRREAHTPTSPPPRPRIPRPASSPAIPATSTCILSHLLRSPLTEARGTDKPSVVCVSMADGGLETPPLKFPSAGWRGLYDRLQGLLPRVEALAADRARLEEAVRLSDAREKSLHARLLQAAYAELPPGTNPKLAERQERDLVESPSGEEALPAADNSQLKETSQKRRKLINDKTNKKKRTKLTNEETGQNKRTKLTNEMHLERCCGESPLFVFAHALLHLCPMHPRFSICAAYLLEIEIILLVHLL
ncbi:hypothetical protein ZWY2020_014075 [Hordeum vulgare]|nr:hypothetical protein ZWY2020_014075 [Hordeum vulgare]